MPGLALGLLVLLAWVLRAFVVAPGPFHENFHGYAALGLDPFSVPGYPRVTSSFLALMGILGLHGDSMIAANQVISALLVVPAALVAAELLGGLLAGLLTGAVIAIHPLLARLGASEDPFTFYIFLVLLAVLAGRLALRRDSLVAFAGAAALASVAAFVRDSTVLAGPVFVLLTLDRLPPGRRRLPVLGLCLLPFAAGAIRLLTFDSLPLGEGAAPGPSALDQLLLIARWATLGGLGVRSTPAAFPVLALLGLALLVWRRPASALRIVLALGLLQGPFALVLATAASPFSAARHLSPAIVLWALPAAFALATVAELVRARLPRLGAAWTPVFAVALVLASAYDAWPLLARTTLVEREYAVMKDCLERLPAEARYQPLDEDRASHVVSEKAWLRSERPLWLPLNPQVLSDDRAAKRHAPAVLLIDHGCSADVTMSDVPELSAATEPTPWGPMVPACAEAFRGRSWQTVLRVDLALGDQNGGFPRSIPVGCLVEAPGSVR